jgi:hypothetical protein
VRALVCEWPPRATPQMWRGVINTAPEATSAVFLAHLTRRLNLPCAAA